MTPSQRVAPIVKEPDPILRRRAVPVSAVTPEIEAFIDTLIETMHAAEGVGLAANQVGSNRDILVASADGKRGRELVLLNAEIVKKSGTLRENEGCLSLPGISAEVTRAARVTARGLDRRGKPVTIQAEGLLARILQHEVDHLRGRLYVDRLARLRRRRILSRYHQLQTQIRQIDL